MELRERCRYLLDTWKKDYNPQWPDGVIYARFSAGGKQTDQSIEGQIDVDKKFADDNHINLVDIFFDQHVTGTTDKREDFQRMLTLAKRSSWSFVIVYDIERFGRNKDEIATNRRALRVNQKIVLSSTQINSYNADGTRNISGIIMESVHEGMAEYYSVELSLKVKRGQRKNLDKKVFLGGCVPFGYRLENVILDDQVKKRMVIDDERAEITREIFNMYIKGSTIEAIQNHLRVCGLVNQYGRPFSKNQLILLLKNERVVGRYTYGGHTYENYHPAIITQEEFNKVQSRFKRNKLRSGGGKAAEPYLLATKLICGCCQSNMLGESGKTRTLPNGEKVAYHYYKCYGQKRKTHDCDLPTVAKDAIEQFVVEKTIERVFKNTNLAELAHQLYVENKRDQASQAKMTLLRQEYDANDKAIKNVMRAIENGLYTDTTKERLLELEAEKKRIEGALAYEQQAIENELPEDQIFYFLNKLAGGDVNSIAYRQHIIEFFIAKVILYKDRVVIIYRFTDDGGEVSVDRKELDEYIYKYEEAQKWGALMSTYIGSVPPPVGSYTYFFFGKGYFGIIVPFNNFRRKQRHYCADKGLRDKNGRFIKENKTKKNSPERV